MDVVAALISLSVGLLGITVGAFLTRRNEKRAEGERLLVGAFNDAATAIAEVAGGEGKVAQARYASAVSRIALHASPAVISKFREFQDDPTTATQDGRRRLIAAVQEAREELGHGRVKEEDIATLLFGNTEPRQHFSARCRTREQVDPELAAGRLVDPSPQETKDSWSGSRSLG
jgi:hypothetical protein